MYFSTTQALLSATVLASAASAHTVFTNFFVDGLDQGAGVAVRMNKNPAEASFPVENLQSKDMACGFNGGDGVGRVQPVKNGATLTFEFHSWPDDKSKPILDPGHKGPCAVYLKKVDSAVKDGAAGNGWFKIWDEGYDGSQQKWCTNKMIDNKGLLSVSLPKGLQGGYYLVRPELVALHNALNGDPQFYVGCGQIFLEQGGTLAPSETVSIPGHVNANDEAMKWNLYYGTDPNKYPQVGPKVAVLKSNSGSASTAQTSQQEGEKPEGCILENANFCAYEVPSYSDENGCWAAAKNCWEQNDKCWKSAPPTGGSGCKIWEQKCNGINDACNAKNFNGPPNKGKVLTPSQATIDVSGVAANNGGGAQQQAAVPSSPAPAPAASAQKQEQKQNPSAAAPAPSSVEQKKVESSPAPTPAPSQNLPGTLVTVTSTVEVTQYEYVTVYEKKKRHARRGSSRHQHRAGLRS